LPSDAIIIIDDSEPDVFSKTKLQCELILKMNFTCFQIFNNKKKYGRGAAVRLGMQIAKKSYPNLEFVVECDADGSHSACDIHRLKVSAIKADLLVGSRYVSGSSITGWSIVRILFSSAINKALPYVTGVKIQDLTNGLRRYSVLAVDVVLKREQINSGFIYLSEQAMLVNKSELTIDEMYINFVQRIDGESSVTFSEVKRALSGILKLWLMRIFGKI